MTAYNRKVQFARYGEPSEVLQLVERDELPQPGFVQVRVKVLLRPINPSDLMTVRDQYGLRPDLPATPGYEGMGVIEAVGPGLSLLKPYLLGRRVAVLGSTPGEGTWQDYLLAVPFVSALPLPSALPAEYGAVLIVNPMTALIMTRQVLGVKRGDWLLQTAAGSLLGRLVIQLGKIYGFRTINIVRRPEQIAELKQLGADVVIATESGEDVLACIKEVIGGKGVRYAIEAVGGEVANLAARCLGENGRMLLYGALDIEGGVANVQLSIKEVLFKSQQIEGFWLATWVRRHPLQFVRLLNTLTKLLVSGQLKIDTGRTFPLEEIKEAVRYAEQRARGGKVLLDSRSLS